MSAGKRGPVGPLVSTSDEDSEPDSPRGVSNPRGGTISPRSKDLKKPADLAIQIPSPGPISPTAHDHDYDNVSSPGSSASGPTYVRKPGFAHHAHEFIIKVPNKVKKKKIIEVSSVIKEEGQKIRPGLVPPCKPKPRREPLPMRKRALPQSFWQQPNVPHSVSPAYAPLPPLNIRGEAEEDVTGLRPVTPPPEESKDEPKEKPKRDFPKPERKITVANTDLLFKLFDHVEKDKGHKAAAIIKRGRPRKSVQTQNKSFTRGEDPYIVEAVSEKLFPQLTLETSKAHTCSNGHSTLQLVTLKQGDKTVTLPSLSVEQNYSQMLSELVMHI